MINNRILSTILAVTLLFSVTFPTAAFAEEYIFQDDEILFDDSFYQEDTYVYEDEAFLYEDDPVLTDEYYWAEEDFAGDEELIDEEIYFDEAPEEETFVISEEIVEEYQRVLFEEQDEVFDEDLEDLVEFKVADEATFDSGSELTITEEPEDFTGVVGDTAVFSVKAENVASYQWQLSTNGGKTWNNSSTKDTMSFTLTAPDGSENGLSGKVHPDRP